MTGRRLAGELAGAVVGVAVDTAAAATGLVADIAAEAVGLALQTAVDTAVFAAGQAFRVMELSVFHSTPAVWKVAGESASSSKRT